MEQSNWSKIIAVYWNNLKLSNMIIAFLIVLILYFFLNSSYSPKELSDLVSTNKKDIYIIIATIAGTLLGFILTSISVIAAFFDSEKLDIIRSTGKVKDLFNIFFSTIKVLAITTLIAIFGLIFNYWTLSVFYLLIFAVIISSLLIAACIWVLETIVTALGE